MPRLDFSVGVLRFYPAAEWLPVIMINLTREPFDRSIDCDTMSMSFIMIFCEMSSVENCSRWIDCVPERMAKNAISEFDRVTSYLSFRIECADFSDQFRVENIVGVNR